MENIWNHDIQLIIKWDGTTRKQWSRNRISSCSIFAKNLITLELRKLEMKFNKPIYVGMYIFDISKVCLYEFYHEYISSMYRDKCKIMYTDAENLIYRVECENVYEMMKRDIARFERLSNG